MERGVILFEEAGALLVALNDSYLAAWLNGDAKKKLRLERAMRMATDRFNRRYRNLKK